MNVLLVHGLGRTPVSLWLLSARLRKLGLQPERFGYVTALQSVDTIVERLSMRLERLAQSGPYLTVGHSLGGVLLRLAIARLKADTPPPRRLVQLGTPNRSPVSARVFLSRPPLSWWAGDCGRLLANIDRMDDLPLPCIPTTVIAGTAGLYGRFSLYGDQPNDGLVSVAETELPGAERIVRPLVHSLMMNHTQVADLIAAAAR